MAGGAVSSLRNRARLTDRPFQHYQASYTIGPNSIGGIILLPRDRLFGVPKLLKPIGLSGQSYYLASLPILVHLVKELRLAAVLKLAIFSRLANLPIDWGGYPISLAILASLAGVVCGDY